MSESIFSPADGQTTKLENVSDEMFAKKMLGDGIAIIPKSNDFYSPIDGVISMIFDTQHAIGIVTPQGAEILIHIGIDTVNLKGKPFKTQVKTGERVKKGDLLTIVDWNMIKQNGLDVVVPIIVTNKNVELYDTERDVKRGDILFNIL